MQKKARARLLVVIVWVLLPLLLVLVVPPPPVAGQGLRISPEQLGAGEAAVVDQFQRFEEFLDLASQSTGGRGRGGRGGTTSTTGGIGFRSVKSLQQLQLATYYLAGSPPAYNSWDTSQNLGGISLLPGVRDQLDCDSCVGQAIAAAIQAAAAAAWRQNADQARFNVNAASLYYCSEGGKTCKTGWDLQEALAMIMDKSQFLIRPTSCARKTTSGMLDNPTAEPLVFDWKPACRQAEQACISVSSPALPWLSCSYKSLSSFVDIQRHIRQHGGVLTRITIYEDFWKHFNVTSDGGEPRAAVNGATHKAYNRTADSRSKPLFGHAALIVGYNNTELTWTLLNSYGTQRFTRDGLFKIAMGVAGVAVPDQTFGIECKPTPGGPDDLHFTGWLTPWINDTQLRPRKPVDYWDRAQDWNNLNASCYRYNTTAEDTLSSVADAFGVSLQQLVHDNQALFPLQLVNYTLKTGTQLKDLQKVAAVANKLRLANSTEPFFVCRIYTGQTWFGSRACKQSDLGPCAGAWGCKIVFSEADVSLALAPGAALRVCGISRVDEPGGFDRVAYLKEPRDSQPRALKALLQALPGAQQNFVDRPEFGYSYGPFIDATCNDGTLISHLFVNVYFAVKPWPFTFQDARGVYALLNLDELSTLHISITGGTLPPQLGALKLSKLNIDVYCSFKSNDWGPLPDNWLLGDWRNSLLSLGVGAAGDDDHDSGFAAADGRCGVTGTLPAAWFQPGALPTAVTELRLSSNQLANRLPEALPTTMPKLAVLDLSFNAFEGTIPSSFSTFSELIALYLQSNRLSGPMPLRLLPRWLSRSSLFLDNNPGLQGCVPNVPGAWRPQVSYANTAITGMCDADDKWSRQLQALPVFGTDLLSGLLDLKVASLNLPQTVAEFITQYPDAASAPEREYSYRTTSTEVKLRVINGTPCMVGLEVSFSKVVSPVNMTALPDLLRQLPCLEDLRLGALFVKPPKPGVGLPSQLPADLPSAAPSLKELWLSGCGLTGTIPDWKNWTSLEILILSRNFLSGTLPEWRGTQSLTQLDLSTNELVSTLPSAWAGSMPASMSQMVLSSNTGISGSIPASWRQHFSSAFSIDLGGTSLTGCRPLGWRDSYVRWSDALVKAPLCGADEAAVLQQAKQLLEAAIPSLPLLSTWTADDSGLANALPAHCRTWQGTTCNANGQVIGVDLSSLQGAVSSPLNLTALLQPLGGLAQLQTLNLHNNLQMFAGNTIPGAFTWSAWPKLQYLDVSNCGLTGSLPDSLGDLPSLAHLNTSHNPGMSGPLPELLSATSLAVLDVFECGLSGQLPVSFTVLPLRLLRVGSAARPASADGSISGPLPPEYGMINTLRELHIVNTWVTGGIPSAWFDPDEAARAAKAAAAAPAEAVRAALAAAAAGVSLAPSSAQQLAQHAGNAAARMAAAWQRVQDRLTPSTTAGAAATAAAAAPAGEGLSMQQLQALVLSGNSELEGSLPAQLAALKQLKVLRLSGSKLAGPLPRGYGRLSQLQELDLSANQLSGGIPSLWLGLRSLSFMDLSGNPAIGGALPAPLFKMAGPERKLRCVRLFGTGIGDLAAVKATFEGRPGSQVKVAISSDCMC